MATRARQQNRSNTRSRRPGGSTPAKAVRADQSDLAQMKVTELRQLARENSIGGTSAMRKEDLVKAVARVMTKNTGTGPRQGAAQAGGRRATSRKQTERQQSGGARRGARSSRSLNYAQEITSPSDKPERAGRSLVTTSHEVIQRWAREREAVPATIAGTEHDGHPGVLRFDFPGFQSGRSLVHIDWKDWFAAFDARGLNFIYQQNKTDGRQSNFFRLENPGREDA